MPEILFPILIEQNLCRYRHNSEIINQIPIFLSADIYKHNIYLLAVSLFDLFHDIFHLTAGMTTNRAKFEKCIIIAFLILTIIILL